MIKKLEKHGPVAPQPAGGQAYGTWQIERAITGTDLPTDVPRAGFNVLVIQGRRFPIADIASIEPGRAGQDFPTEVPPRDVLIRQNGQRISLESPLRLVAPVAGEDFPTDGPPGLDRATPVLTWTVDGKSMRVRISDLLRIEPAKAGVDYPTDVPGAMNGYYAVVQGEQGREVRLRLTPGHRVSPPGARDDYR
jgi:hypothetical protein